MKLILRQSGCTGITIWSSRRRHISLWRIPALHTVPWHHHLGVITTLTFIAGVGRLSKQQIIGVGYDPMIRHTDWRFWHHGWASFTILNSQWHSARTSLKPLWFFNSTRPDNAAQEILDPSKNYQQDLSNTPVP